MKSYLERKLLKSPKWYLLLLIPLIFLLTFLTSEVENFGGEDSDHQKEQSILHDIRNKHLLQYNPNAPTNYSGSHKGWKQMMSHEVAKRLNYKMNGFFVECGALDGVYLSNTLLLETMYRWTGLLVEADPASASVLKTRNRQAWVADVCLSPNPYPIQVEMAGHRNMFELSYIKNDVIDEGNQRMYDTGFNRKIKVQCYPLAMLMEALDRTEIDYFSLDVEGLELDILTTIPFDKIHIKLISVEVRPANKKSIQDFLEPLGYKRVRQIKSDTEFMHDDLYEFMLK